MGSGGAPEGVLAAAALRCVGGQFQGRLLFRNDDERGRARQMGRSRTSTASITLEDMAKGDCIFAATGVTDGSLLEGVKRRKGMHDHRQRGDARELGHGAARVHRISATSTHRGL